MHFPNFWCKGSVNHTFIWVSSTMPKFSKTLIIQFQEKKDGQKDRWKDRQTLFYRTLPATLGGPTQY